MSDVIRKGTKVCWSWGSGEAEGKVTALHHQHVERTIKGSKVSRHGTGDDPAVEIEQEDGTKVLKLRSEVKRA